MKNVLISESNQIHLQCLTIQTRRIPQTFHRKVMHRHQKWADMRHRPKWVEGMPHQKMW